VDLDGGTPGLHEQVPDKVFGFNRG